MIYLGIDLGGTNIKVAAVDAAGKILAESARPTNLPRSAEAVADDIALTMEAVLLEGNFAREDIAGVGFGCPGMVDDEAGVVLYSNNLAWEDFDLRSYLKEKTGFSIRLANDANAAALGEALVGGAKGAHSAAILTLGTGVGCGVVLEGKMLTGYTGAASELGHMVVHADGVPCTCGRKGCLESYVSATGLIRMTKEAMEENPGSLMCEIAKEDGRVTGRTAFLAKEKGDIAGSEVVEKYIHYLAIGVANVVNIFFPEVIALSGGVANEGESLLVPLRAEVAKMSYGADHAKKHTRIQSCTLGYQSGVIGAAMVCREGEQA